MKPICDNTEDTEGGRLVIAGAVGLLVITRLCAASPPIAVTAIGFVGVIITAVLAVSRKNLVRMAPTPPGISTFISTFGGGRSISIKLR